jgi:peroxiredoxin
LKEQVARMHDPSVLPEDLPVPRDDGAADHLIGLTMPPIALPSTDGGDEQVDIVPEGYKRRILFVYPRTGRPGEAPLVDNWDAIPGARGCTPEACGFKSHAARLRAVGAYVAGLSTQDSEYQREVIERLSLPFPLLSDRRGRLSAALALPSFTAGGQLLLKRLTLIIRDGRIEHVFYPVYPPDSHAEDVVRWIEDHERGASHDV